MSELLEAARESAVLLLNDPVPRASIVRFEISENADLLSQAFYYLYCDLADLLEEDLRQKEAEDSPGGPGTRLNGGEGR